MNCVAAEGGKKVRVDQWGHGKKMTLWGGEKA